MGWLAFCLVALLVGAAYGRAVECGAEAVIPPALWFALLGGLVVPAVFLFPDFRSERVRVSAILLFALALRLVFVAFFPDGGIPGGVGGGGAWRKGAVLVADAGLLAGVLVVLRRRGLALEFSGLYAFNPVVLAAFTGGAGTDTPGLGPSLLGLSGAGAAGLGGLAILVLALWFWRRRDFVVWDAVIRWVGGGWLIFGPMFGLAAVACLLPFVCLRPSLPWLTFALTGGLLVGGGGPGFFSDAAGGGAAGWLFALLLWGPFVLAGGYEVCSTWGRTLPGLGRRVPGGPADRSVAVVVPALNVAEFLPRALASIERQTSPVAEVVVVDGGSGDGTVAVAESSGLPLRVISSPRGRGVQIARGMEAAESEWVLVLHADGALAEDAVARLLRAVSADPQVMGGALGVRFRGEHPELLPIEILNDLRVVFSKTAFGDQGQFFHGPSAAAFGFMPAQPLMEDIESSWRVREHGGFLYLGCPCEVSHRRWVRGDWLRRFLLVLRLVARYRRERFRCGRQTEALACQMYAEYYRSRNR